jgi:hypothetical protein
MHLMNPHLGPHSDEHEHLKDAALLLMALGGFHLLFSIISMLVILISPTISLLGASSLFAVLNVSEFYYIHALISGYVALQVCFGWVIGLFTIQAGRDCQQTHAWHFVFRMIVLNWCMFPVGTIMGVFIWKDLRRKGIRNVFDDV